MIVLILGGYGTFGGRLVKLLCDEAGLELVIAGRSEKKADKFVDTCHGAAHLRCAIFDRCDIKYYLKQIAPDVVVDASGPFQDYGRDPYSVVDACIEAGVPYLDLADSTQFVQGIDNFHQRAIAADLFVLSGVSTCPALTSAVLDELSIDTAIHAVRAGIAPAPGNKTGLSVVESILNYAGKPIKLWRDGQWQQALALIDACQKRIAPPGIIPLASKRFTLVEVPDLHVLPLRHNGLHSVWFGAALSPVVFHWALTVLSRLRALLKLSSLTPLAQLSHRVFNSFSWGEQCGGMFVEVDGTRNGEAITQSWHLIAQGDDGPFIPAIPAAVIVKKLARGITPEPGARAATGELNPADFETEFKNLAILSGFQLQQHQSVYAALLCGRMQELPELVQELHAVQTSHQWQGVAEIQGGENFLAKLVAKIIGFPSSGSGIPLTVTLTREGTREIWQRNFNGQKFQSIQWAGTGRHQYLLMEQFGLIVVRLALVIRGSELHLVPVGWSFAGISLPRLLLPRGTTFETVRDGKFAFNVSIEAPIVGRIVAYRGTLEKSL